jgi:MFS family permease
LALARSAGVGGPERYGGAVIPDQEVKPPLFAVLVLPYAWTASVTALLIPYLLRKHDVPVDQIAGIVALANLPTICAFLWSPLVDAALQKRAWVALSAFGAGLTACGAILGVEGSPVLLTILLLLMNGFGGLLSSACGALLTAVPAELRGLAAGWYQGANFGGMALGGALLIWLADHAQLSTLAFVSMSAMILPAGVVLWIEEQRLENQTIRHRTSEFAADIQSIFRSPKIWMGLLFLLSPVGSSAVSHLISGMGQDYGASATVVVWVTGLGSGVLAALGSLIGGIVADRFGRLLAYPIAGGLACVFGLYLAFGDPTPLTYAAGYSGYSVAAGFAYAVYTAIVLDIVGPRKHAAASGYALLNSAGNLPIAYMTWIDGLAYRHGGSRGTMLTDAAANGIFAGILLTLAFFLRRRWSQ